MTKSKPDFSRRDFLRTAGVVGIGSMLSPIDNLTNTEGLLAVNKSQQRLVPTRAFGKTGVKVPILSLGGAFGRSSDLLLKQAINMGVRLWDTAAAYLGGNSEKAIGKYFAKFPEDREKVFLVTRIYSVSDSRGSVDLDLSLERLNTSYIDLFLVHHVSNVDLMAIPRAKLDVWSEKRKSEGKIRFFGFSTHNNMEDNLLKASKYGWVDGIMFAYNFRTMHSENMKKAVDACAEAGIGLIAMKTQATGYMGFTDRVSPNEKEQALFRQLAEKGLTFEQAKLKAVWEDQRIASITSAMTNMTILNSNVTAALSDTKLSLSDKKLMNHYARQTASNYCTGCASICESSINYQVPISDVMRYLMYCRGYGEPERAKLAFRRLPSKTREIMANLDYKKAEKKCPQKIKISRLMREAEIELT